MISVIGEQTCAACKIFSNSCHFLFLCRVLRSRDTHTRNGRRKRKEKITHTHTHDRAAGLHRPSEVFLRALVSMCVQRGLPNERGGRAARRLLSDGWVTTCNLRWHKSNSRCRCQTNDLAFTMRRTCTRIIYRKIMEKNRVSRGSLRGNYTWCCWKNGVDFTAHYENGLLHAQSCLYKEPIF